MNKLESALAFAREGYAVFPLVENGNKPLPGSRGHLEATTDPDAVRAMWSDPIFHSAKSYNIGIRPQPHQVFIDLDVKKGRDGIGNYLRLGGVVDGRITRTPSGGLHIWCTTDKALSTHAGKIADGVDVRGVDGYVAAPGSVINGVEYVLVQDDPPQPVPPHIAELIGSKADRLAPVTTYNIEDDRPENVERFVAVCRRAEAACDGMWHAASRDLACEAVRLAVSCEKAVEVMLEHWVPRGTGFYLDGRDERWEGDVQGSYEWGLSQGDHGLHSVDLARASFDGIVVTVPPVEASEIAEEPDIMLTRTVAEGRALRELPVPYIIKGLLGPGDLAAVLGAPGCGKSVLLPHMAFCSALGLPFLGRKVKPTRTIYFATENGEGLERRIQVAADELGDPGDMLRVAPLPMNLSETEAVDEPELARFMRTLRTYEPGVVIIDTLFAGFPNTDLTDRAKGIGWVVNVSKSVAKLPFRPLLVYGHHTPKTGETAYGGQQIQAMFDSTLFLEGELKADRKVTIRKNRMGPDGDQYKFRIKSAPVCVDEEGDTITAALLEWVADVSDEEAEKQAQEAWLAAPAQGQFRIGREIMADLTKEAFDAGRGSSPGDIMGGGPIARVVRKEWAENLVRYGLVDESETPAVRDKIADNILKSLKAKGFAEYDSTHVWTLRR